MEGRYDFPNFIERVTGGQGSENLLIFGSAKTALWDAGMAYSGEKLVTNIKAALEKRGLTDLDFVILSHTHYDHIGGLPAIIKEWPGVRVVAAKKAKKVFASKGAMDTIARLSKAAAELYSKEFPEENWSGALDKEFRKDLSLLRVDKAVKDNDIVDLGDKTLRVIETKGHTDCSLSFLMEPDHILLTSESTGVFRNGKVSSEIVKSYNDAVEAAKKCLALKPKRIIVPHYGILPEDETLSFFTRFLMDAVKERTMVLEAYEKTGSVDATIAAFVNYYWKEEYSSHQPKDAFLESSTYTVINMLRETGMIN